jgi:hypothetical protein
MVSVQIARRLCRRLISVTPGYLLGDKGCVEMTPLSKPKARSFAVQEPEIETYALAY